MEVFLIQTVEVLILQTAVPDCKTDPSYNQELDAAKYYGIENAKSMPREKLQKELENRGYRTQTVRETKPYTFKSAYQRNMERNRRRMKK